MKNCILSLVFRKDLIHLDVESSVSRMQTVIELGRVARDRKTLPLKYPLPELVILHNDPKYLSDVLTLQAYVREVTAMGIDQFSYGETFGHFFYPKMNDFLYINLHYLHYLMRILILALNGIETQDHHLHQRNETT